ncbi:class II glutamine amidotransferase [Streptomyces griseoviridis]|jgi:predicted glutamine amidotransferase|uniref:Class II glutamine amidotransferase n=3 Tax=Streptomyces TaxID=1883 RepID=A0A918LJW4_STRGD|nr:MULTISPECIES: class II glutamine amidotransferase [Streptomyces]MDP9685083.1 putative glutamine amidotransferase [Streptomyces griseoviridis]GGS62827.1 class II glutamine amidotransferase [Streptomyces niveoruber]GGT14871.1 class II glutamine amidotransferase [Streptomyces griseoviridis]GGU60063.1 class II glutamine amidotransferase [Streptomyces daghestanicus]GHI31981.1 class II glutamine amidotransferase [Streptomyces daghestanicus]
MCRLIGAVSRQTFPLRDLFADDLEPFLELAEEHGDGWGTAVRVPDGTVEAVKAPERAHDGPLLNTVLNLSESDAALLHLRMASPGLPVDRTNTHPFGDRDMAFAHNGDFVPVDVLDTVIGPDLLASAHGTTDSERFYLAVRRRVDDGLDPVKALMQAADDIRAAAERSASLNCLLLTSEALYAYTEHDPHSVVIDRRGTGYFGLRYRTTEDGRAVVASTGWPQPSPEWTHLPERHVLRMSPGTLDLTVHGR